MPKTYRQKPPEIQAMQYTAESAEAVAEWLVENDYPWLVGNALEPETLRDPAQEGKPQLGIWIDPADGLLMIRIYGNDMKVNLGDYVVQGPQFYPSPQDEFNAAYEAAV